MRKIKKYLLKVLSILIFTILAFVPEIQIIKDNTFADIFVRALFVALLFILSEIITNVISSRYNPFEDLIVFLNKCLKMKVDIVSLFENTVSSSENELSCGDEMHILTNDLMNYDLHEQALRLIAKSLLAGAIYYYYVPETIKDDYKSFKLRLSDEIQKQIGNDFCDDASIIMDNQLFFFFIPDENFLSYNFSITFFNDPRKNTGCWYISEKDITVNSNHEDVPDLLMVRMKSFEDIKMLKSIFVKLVKRYKIKMPKGSRLFL